MSTGVTKPPGERDWEKWDLPPYNEDWTGFVNLLGTREIKQNKTAAYDSEEDRIKDAPGFPSRWMRMTTFLFQPMYPPWTLPAVDIGPT